MRMVRVVTVLISAAAASVGLGAGCASEEPRALPSQVTLDDSVVPGYVGSDACASCHEDKDSAWSEREGARIWPSAK